MQLTGLTTVLSDRYRLQRELGTGGIATVWLAEDLRHHLWRRPSGGTRMTSRGLELDPNSVLNLWMSAIAHRHLGDLDEAGRQMMRAADLAQRSSIFVGLLDTSPLPRAGPRRLVRSAESWNSGSSTRTSGPLAIW